MFNQILYSVLGLVLFGGHIYYDINNNRHPEYLVCAIVCFGVAAVINEVNKR